MASPPIQAIVLAAGHGRRMGKDKALLELGGETALQRILRHLGSAGLSEPLVVRRRGAEAVDAPGARVVELAVDDGEMLDSVRAGIAAAPDAGGYLLFPVDYAMVGPEVLPPLLTDFDPDGDGLVLPLCLGRPGHPILISGRLREELTAPELDTLRTVVRRDRSRVRVVPVEDSWVRRDLDRPEDLAAARAALECSGSPAQWMARHRSCRSFRPDPVSRRQLEWLVDVARRCSTSSYMQAATVVAVTDPERKAAAARLCADQAHIHQAPVFLAICADLARIAAACEREGQEFRPDGLELFLQATVDAALVGQNLQLAAQSEGLGACMIGAARRHPVELAQLLELPPTVYVVYGMALGWPEGDGVQRDRLPLAAVLHHDRYDREPMATWLDAADEAMRTWARQINAAGGYGGRKVNEAKGWTPRMARLWGGSDRPKDRSGLLEAMRQLGFGLPGGDSAAD